MLDAALTTIEEWSRAWEDAFDALLIEGEGFAGFMESLAQGIGAALLAGVADYARGKARSNIAEAIEQTAKGIGASAIGNFAGASAHFKAAATHVAAAAAWGALAGAAASGSNAVRGGGNGRNSASSSIRDTGADVAKRAEVAGPEINVYLEGDFDALNPRVQRMVAGATQEWQKNAGPNARVFVHRRRG